MVMSRRFDRCERRDAVRLHLRELGRGDVIQRSYGRRADYPHMPVGQVVCGMICGKHIRVVCHEADHSDYLRIVPSSPSLRFLYSGTLLPLYLYDADVSSGLKLFIQLF